MRNELERGEREDDVAKRAKKLVRMRIGNANRNCAAKERGNARRRHKEGRALVVQDRLLLLPSPIFMLSGLQNIITPKSSQLKPSFALEYIHK